MHYTVDIYLEQDRMMDKQVAASEVRDLAKRGTNAMQQLIDGHHMLHIPPQHDDADMVIAECLRTMDAFADLLEAREKVVSVRQFRVVPKGSTWTDVKDDEIWAAVTAHPESYETRILYTHPAPADESAQTNDDAEQLRLCREDWQKVCDVIHPGWHFNPEEIVEKLKAAADSERLADQRDDAFQQAVQESRRVWMDEFPCEAGHDHVTPFDQFSYGMRAALEAALAAQENPND